jgi:hypothetical protein
MPSDHIHYHVARHSGDDDVYVTASIFGALDYAAEELGTLADFEWEYVAEIARRVAEEPRPLAGETSMPAGEMADALRALVRSETYANLKANAENMSKQHGLPNDKRAPLYVNHPDRCGDNLLLESARRVTGNINDDSPLTIGECSGELLDEDSDDGPRCSYDA